MSYSLIGRLLVCAGAAGGAVLGLMTLWTFASLVLAGGPICAGLGGGCISP